MTKKLPFYTVIILMVLAAVLTFNATYLVLSSKYNEELNNIISSRSYFDKLLSVDELIKKNFIGEIDNEKISDSLLRGYMEGLGDQYSYYMTSSEYEQFLSSQDGQTVGIGVHVIYNSENGTLDVISVMENSPAMDAGLLPGDLIVSVEGQLIADIGYYSALELVRGTEGTEVKFSVIRGENENIEFTCVRKEMIEQSVEYHVYKGKDGVSTDIGIIRISSFDSTTPDQFKKAIEALKHQDCIKFVFDLRYNPGGELSSIVSVLDFLLPEGPVVRIFDRDGKETVEKSDASFLDAKTAILVNEQTASAAELFSSAMKDYAARGDIDSVLVGTTTYGKGTMQRIYPLKDGSAIKLSFSTYNPPYSDNYNGIGIEPDIKVELSEEAKNINFYKLTDEMDNQLQVAISKLS